MYEPIELSTATSRRFFLQSAISTGVMLAVGPQFGCAPGGGSVSATPPVEEPGAEIATRKFNDLRIAYIGTGGIGGHHFEETVQHGVRCECFCDVDRNEWPNALKHFPNARGYQDYREMLDKERNNFDAVMVGVPDHHHYPATILAMQAGKHVYTQKPLTHTVWEARQLTEAARRYKVATQMGNQGHAGEGWRLVYEWIRGGALGTVREVHTWTDRPIWPQGKDRPEGEDAVPAHLDWDVWLGPAPLRPFKEKVYHRFAWRGWWDFGCGALGDMACHTMDGMFWAMDPGYPTFVEPVGVTPVTPDMYPTASVVHWKFPGRGLRAGFDAYWYDGGLLPMAPGDMELDRKLPSTGNLFVGTKASMLVSGDYGNSPRLVPESRMKSVGKPKKMLERSPGHVLEWLMACVGDKPIDFPKSNFSYAGPMTETINLGNVALRAGRRLEWDGPGLKFRNAPELDALLTKEYRDGWKF